MIKIKLLDTQNQKYTIRHTHTHSIRYTKLEIYY